MRNSKFILTFISLIVTTSLILINCEKNIEKKKEVESEQKYFNISPDSAYQMLTNPKLSDSIIVLDVRTKREYSEGYIDSAININYYSDNFKKDVSGLDKNKIYILYCKSGGRSALSCEIMSELGFNRLYNIEGGFEAWVKSGLPYKK